MASSSPLPGADPSPGSASAHPISAADVLCVRGTHGDQVDAFAHATTGSAEQLGRWWLAHPEISREQVTRYLVDNVWASFEALRQRP